MAEIVGGGIGSGETLLTSVFVAFEGAFAYSAMLPSLMTMRTFVDTVDKVHSIRQGEVIATVFAGIFAMAVACITGSSLPLVLTGIACVFMLAVYEYGLRQSPAWEEFRLAGH